MVENQRKMTIFVALNVAGGRQELPLSAANKYECLDPAVVFV